MSTQRLVLTIPEDGVVSNAVRLGKRRRGLLFFPAGWTAADLSIQTADEDGGGDWIALPDFTQTRIDLVVTADGMCLLPPELTSLPDGVRIRLWSHTDGTDEPQLTADRTFVLMSS